MATYVGCCCGGSGSGSGVECRCPDPGETLNIQFEGLASECTYDHTGCPYTGLRNTTYSLTRCLQDGCVHVYKLGGLSPCDIFELYDSGDDNCSICPDNTAGDACLDAETITPYAVSMYSFIGTKTNCDGAGSNFDIYLGITVIVSGSTASTALRVQIAIRTIAVQTNLSPVAIFMNYLSSYGFGAYYINLDCSALGGGFPCFIGEPIFGSSNGWYGDTEGCLPQTFTQPDDEECCRDNVLNPITCTVS